MSPRVLLLDYGSGNIRSVQRALHRAGADVTVSADASEVRDAAGVVVPGVGAFAACMGLLSRQGLDKALRTRIAGGRPVLGICVGHQVLFSRGDERGDSAAGLGVWPESVTRLETSVVPHVGWNTVSAPPESAMFRGISGEFFYFVHSYAVSAGHAGSRGSGGPLDSVTRQDGQAFLAAREDGPVWSAQFHPEKSGDAGSAVLRNWVGQL